MEDNLIEKIRNDFDHIALLEPAKWDHNNHYHSFLLDRLPNQSNLVLDIGCGTGEFSRLLAQRFERVIAIDLSPKMIQVARQNSTNYSNINFQVADILQWQFPLEKFEAIVSIATVHHLPLEKLLPILKAALKPGGKLLFLDLIEYDEPQDLVRDAISIPLNWGFQLIKNRRIKPTRESIKAWNEHGRTDNYLTSSQIKQIYPNFLESAKIRKHLFWRYSVVWEKPQEWVVD
jgi:SAM-dependent methyltransferase